MLVGVTAAFSSFSVWHFVKGFTFLGPCPNMIPFATLQEKGFVGFDNTLKFFGTCVDPGEKTVPPAKSSVRS